MCSSASRTPRAKLPILGLTTALCALPVAAQHKVLVTAQEALALAFPKAQCVRKTLYLTKAEASAVRKAAGSPLRRRVVFRFTARIDNEVIGWGYLERHRVRTHEQVLLVMIHRSGKLARIEVLSFDEPQAYRPRKSWYRQFEGRKLSKTLRLKQEIRGVVGSTLTALATTRAARRVLALHTILSRRKPTTKPSHSPKRTVPSTGRPVPGRQNKTAHHQKSIGART